MWRLKQFLKYLPTLSVVGTLVGAAIGFWKFYQQYELDVTRSLNEANLKTCGDVVEKAAHLFSPDNQTDFSRALRSFQETKHGLALLLLNQEVLDRMVQLYNDAETIQSDSQGEEFKALVTKTICNQPFDLARECRKMLAANYLGRLKVASMAWDKTTCVDQQND